MQVILHSKRIMNGLTCCKVFCSAWGFQMMQTVEKNELTMNTDC